MTENKPVIKYGPWEKHHFCVECHEQITDPWTRFPNDVCPRCGRVGRIGMDCYSFVERKVYTYIPTLFERIFYRRKSEWHWEKRNERAGQH